MSNYFRFALGDKVEIIDETSLYRGKRGVVKNAGVKPLKRINIQPGTQESEPEQIIELEIELEGIDDHLKIWSHPKPLASQIRKLE